MVDKNGRQLVICDNGTGVSKVFSYDQQVFNFLSLFKFLYFNQFVKCGFAGNNFPLYTFPSIVGRPIIRAKTKIDNIELSVCCYLMIV